MTCWQIRLHNRTDDRRGDPATSKKYLLDDCCPSAGQPASNHQPSVRFYGYEKCKAHCCVRDVSVVRPNA
ncbi:hypothetical protein RP20_CCG017349 [Aedes albopictus]|nr:hypothetical protein RP20_CCG017349 [Aedes albopictus]